MNSSRIISLFSERSQPSQRPSSFVVSILAHAAAVTLLSIGILYAPDSDNRIVPRRFTIRHLDLHTPEEKAQAASKGVTYPGPQGHPKTGRQADRHMRAPGKQPRRDNAVLRQTVNAKLGPQTLIQPDIPDPVNVTELTPVPTVVIWTPKKEEVKQVVAPLPEKATAADVKSSVNAPNQELDLGDIGVSSTETPTDSLALAPTTTSPLQVQDPSLVQLAPVTASQTQAQPTPVAVMSISDLRMPDGTATLPPVNQATEQNESGTFAPGRASSGRGANPAGGTDTDHAEGEAKTSDVKESDLKTSGTGPARGSGTAPDAEEGFSTAQISLPKNGQFGAVVVGASLEQKFPEMSGVWNDRVAYTVYLHVGLAKSWILQYSLPRSSEAAQAGSVSRLDAPWPFNIVRPNIGPGMFNTDAILVHGYVNEQGKFESLALAFPPGFQQAQFVLEALNQWQFRPAAQNGQTEKVEVLLIIPEEQDQIPGQMP